MALFRSVFYYFNFNHSFNVSPYGVVINLFDYLEGRIPEVVCSFANVVPPFKSAVATIEKYK